jgi:hypothetical protein
MESPLPFFYYDILARIVPGAATLAVLWQLRCFGPIHWLKAFTKTGEVDGWEKLVIPFILIGISYAIGVVFEVVDYIFDFDVPDDGKKWRVLQRRLVNPMMTLSVYVDDRAFFSAVARRGNSALKKKCGDWKNNRAQITKRRSDLWERLTYQGGSDEKKKLIFAHCHRFQSEQKMFFHLIYPSLLFAFLWKLRLSSYFPNPFPVRDFIISLVAALIFAFCCRSRCRRRWLQVVTFSLMIDDEADAVRPAAEE